MIEINRPKRIYRPRCVVQGWLTEKQIADVNTCLTLLLNSRLNSAGTEAWIYVRDLVGGEARNWPDPLKHIYNVWYAHDPDTAFTNAAMDMGKFLKRIIADCDKAFEMGYAIRTRNEKKVPIRAYRWLGK